MKKHLTFCLGFVLRGYGVMVVLQCLLSFCSEAPIFTWDHLLFAAEAGMPSFFHRQAVHIVTSVSSAM